MVFRESQPSLSVVSNGAECLLLSKSFFKQHSCENIINSLRKSVGDTLLPIYGYTLGRGTVVLVNSSSYLTVCSILWGEKGQHIYYDNELKMLDQSIPVVSGWAG